MATKTLLKTTLQIVVEDSDGNTSTISLSKIDLEATNEQLLTAAEGIGELQKKTVKDYKLVERSILGE